MSPFLYEIIVYLVEALISGIFLINMLEEKYHKWLHFTLWCEIVIVAMLIKKTEIAVTNTRVSFTVTDNALAQWWGSSDE